MSQDERERLQRRLKMASAVETSNRLMRLRSKYERSVVDRTVVPSNYRDKTVQHAMAEIESRIRVLQNPSHLDSDNSDEALAWSLNRNKELKKHVKQHTKALIGSLNPPPSIPAEELETFQVHKTGGPSIENFRWDFAGHIDSEWNVMASNVFHRSFLKEYPATTTKEMVDVDYHFKQYLIKVEEENHRSEDSPAKLSELRHLKLLATRLFQSQRCDHTSQDRITRQLLDLGPEGMSSDESDKEGSDHLHYIKTLPWRSRELTETLRSLDKEFISSKLNIGSHLYISKEFATTRIPNHELISKRDPIGGMSLESYDAEWLQDLPISDRIALKVRRDQAQ